MNETLHSVPEQPSGEFAPDVVLDAVCVMSERDVDPTAYVVKHLQEIADTHTPEQVVALVRAAGPTHPEREALLVEFASAGVDVTSAQTEEHQIVEHFQERRHWDRRDVA